MLITLLIILVILSVWIFYRYRKDENVLWNALSATGTFFAVVVVLYLSISQELNNRSNLEMQIPKYSNNFIRWGNIVGQDEMFYSVDIEIINTGPAIGRDCQPFLTSVGVYDHGKWTRIKNWVPMGLVWVLPAENYTNPFPETRNLALRMPYVFSLGGVKEMQPNTFKLDYHSSPTGQPDKFQPGEYCFEITVYSSNANTITKYFKIIWRGDFKQENIGQFRNADNFKEKLVVSQLKKSPWRK